MYKKFIFFLFLLMPLSSKANRVNDKILKSNLLYESLLATETDSKRLRGSMSFDSERLAREISSKEAELFKINQEIEIELGRALGLMLDSKFYPCQQFTRHYKMAVFRDDTGHYYGYFLTHWKELKPGTYYVTADYSRCRFKL